MLAPRDLRRSLDDVLERGHDVAESVGDAIVVDDESIVIDATDEAFAASDDVVQKEVVIALTIEDVDGARSEVERF